MGYELRRQLREALGPDVTGLQRAVALEIADDANERTRMSMAPLDDIARWTGAKDTSVIRNALKRLAAAGWEFRIPIGKGKDGRVLYAVPGTRMTFRVPDFKGVATATPTESKGEHGLTQGGAPATPSSPQGGAGAHSEGATAHSEGAVAPPYSSDSSDSKELASKPVVPVASGIPDFARPLVDQITNAGIHVRWARLSNNEWLQVHSLMKDRGIPAMVDVAIKASSRTQVEYARYFLPGWRELAPLPEPGAERPPLRSVPTARSTADERVAAGQALAAKFRAEEARALETARTSNQELA